jgi:hypothetical protein
MYYYCTGLRFSGPLFFLPFNLERPKKMNRTDEAREKIPSTKTLMTPSIPAF